MKAIDGIDFHGQKGSNAADPSTGTDLVTKQYGDAHYGGSASRATATATTSSLAANAKDSTTTIPLAKSYRLISIATSRPARVELYTTAAAKTADAGRDIGLDPTSSAGVVLDYVTPAASTTYSFSPVVEGSNLEGTPTSTISMRVTNLDVTTGTVVVTLIYVATE
jgi:hypothetical protein